jgi:type II restriction enzyme
MIVILHISLEYYLFQEVKMEKIDRLFKENLKEFIHENGENSITKISDFLNNFREIYEKTKYQEFLERNFTPSVAQNKARNSWVAYVGRKLEDLIFAFLNEFCAKNNILMVKGASLKTCNNNELLSKIRRKIEISFNEYSLLPDADIVIYRIKNNEPQILAILSIKNSFRERYTETPYWKLKLLGDKVTEHIKVFMITPDNDDEISFKSPRPRQARIVLEYELDSIYLLKNDFDKSRKVKSISEIFKDLKNLIG